MSTFDYQCGVLKIWLEIRDVQRDCGEVEVWVRDLVIYTRNVLRTSRSMQSIIGLSP